jgi:beta-fructofuranosidase
VLIYSTERKVFWESGELDHEEMTFHSQKRGLLDFGAFYAPKTQIAANGDRILWGWIPETRSEVEYSKAGWAGCMSLPRVLSLDRDGALITKVSPKAAKLRAKPFSLPTAAASSAERLRALRELRIGNLAGEISLRIRPAPFSMNLTDGDQSFLKITFDPARSGSELVVNGLAAALPARNNQELAITLLIDGSVIECFVNGTTCLTTRVYQIPVKPLHVDIAENSLVNVLSLQAWQITPISVDRLTT